MELHVQIEIMIEYNVYSDVIIKFYFLLIITIIIIYTAQYIHL